MTTTIIHDPDLLARIAVMETAVYDPPRLGHEFIAGVDTASFPDSPMLAGVCKHCNITCGWEQWPSDKQPCPSRPIPDPDWFACLELADIFEEHGDLVTAAWWRWLEREKKVPQRHSHGFWDWWPDEPEFHDCPLTCRLHHDVYYQTTWWYLDQGRYPTRRAAYDDLKRVWCQQHAATEGS